VKSSVVRQEGGQKDYSSYVLGGLLSETGSFARLFSATPGAGTVHPEYDGALVARVVSIASIMKRNQECSEEEAGGVFQRELRSIRSHQRLKHENIIAVLGVFAVAGSSKRAFFSLHPRCFGGDLSLVADALSEMRRRMKVEGQQRKEIAQACDEIVHPYISVLLDVLAYLHGKGIVHRDMKVENILFSRARLEGASFPPAKELRVIDFGFAREGVMIPALGEDPHPGTLPYASPALLSGGPYDGREADVYAMACVIYILLMDDLPFDNSGSNDQSQRNYENGDFVAELSLANGKNTADEMLALISSRSFCFLSVVFGSPPLPRQRKQPTIAELRVKFPWCASNL